MVYPEQYGNAKGLKAGRGYARPATKKCWSAKEIGKDKDGAPIMVDVVPSVKVLLDVHKLILAYTWGTPTQQGQDELERMVDDLYRRVEAAEAAVGVKH